MSRRLRLRVGWLAAASGVAVGALTLGALTIGTRTVGAQGAPSRPGPVALALRPYIATLRTVPVGAGGETLPFLLDTGGGFTVLTPEVARAAACTPFGRVTVFRSSGERIDLPRCGPVRLTVGGVAMTGEAAVLDVMRLLEGAPRVGGIVSLQTLEGRAFTLDLAGNRLVLETPASLAVRTRAIRPLSVRLSRQGGGAAMDLFLEVASPGGSLWLELDSGNAGPVLLSPHAVAQLGATLSGEGPQRVTLDVRGLGPVPVDAVVKELIYDGLLNATFLEAVVLTVDLKTSRAWAVRRP